MSIKIIQEKLKSYQPKNALDEENALKEITQEIALSGLSRAGFFKTAAFQGGTCLRILHGLGRFSEDLDFALNKPSRGFNWTPYLQSLKTELEAYGYALEIEDRGSQAAVKTGFIKDDSIGKLLVLHYGNKNPKKLKIKLEIDTNPPAGATTEQHYVEFPLTTPVLAHDLSSLFAGKSHALLCREWEKGRDWFDFLWYVSRKTPLNYRFLSHAINQMGPWRGKKIKVTREWYIETLREKVQTTNWKKQKADVIKFLKPNDQVTLDLWNTDFFLDRVKAVEKYLS